MDPRLREDDVCGEQPFPAGPPVLPNHNQTTPLGGSGRLAAKQDARPTTPSRRGRRSYRTTTKPPRPVGAVAWPRSRMHGPRPPSRRGRRSYRTTTKPPHPVGAVDWPRSAMLGPQPLPGGAAGPTKPQPNHLTRWERSP